MKSLWFLFLFAMTTSYALGQVQINGVDMVLVNVRDGRNVVNVREVQGSPFASDGWHEGSLVMSNGLKYTHADLNFDLFSNKPAFLENGKNFHFRDPVREIMYTGVVDNVRKTFVFRNEYPPVGKLDKTFFYQVEAEGSTVHLLKMSEKIEHKEMVNIGVYSSHFKLQEEWYLYDVAANKVIKIPKSRKEFLSLSSSLSTPIQDYLKQHNSFNPKKADELVAFATALNK